MESILSKFQQIVSECQQAVALKERGRQFTYEQLDKESDKIAHYLIENGFEKGNFVAIYLKRSIDTVVALLGVLKAGGIYVSLDPTHPNERNHYIIQDINASFVISNEGSLKKLHDLQLGNAVHIVQLEKLAQHIVPADFTAVCDELEDVCYTIFTSGTTGKPKGTLIRQQGVVNLVHYMQQHWHVTREDRVLQFATYSFDASVLDTFLSLLTGSTLYLIDDEERMAEQSFLDVVSQEQITVIPVLPTVFFNRIVNDLTEETAPLFASVKLVGVGGELLTGDLARKFKASACGEARFFNLYGPTEITVMATAYEVPADLAPEVYSVPIGQQLPGNKVYVVNEEGELCADDEVGELWVASVGISLGYLHNEEKTAEVFVENPFDAHLYGGMVYKTGDLVKRLVDGNIEFVSRKDTQVKIRGHRIEIAEIETRLNELAGVDNAVVVVEQEGDEPILKAFFTAQQPLDAAHLVNRLKNDLPSYMMPTKCRQLDEIPFAPTGKVDRKALEKVTAERVAFNTGVYVAPRNAIEQDIARVWQQVLKLERVSVTDDLFDIGGHSLKIIEMLSSLKKTYATLTIKDFFDLKTVEKLAEKVAKTQVQEESAFNGEFTQLTEWPKMDISAELPKAQTILVTGATGFLGSHIAYQLVQAGKQVVLLVRGDDARARAEATMQQYFNETLAPTITVVRGDMTEQYFGMAKQQFEALAMQLDAIIHSAADVRHFGNREHFEKVNVVGTQHIFELVNINPAIVFHHISTVGVVQDLLAERKWQALQGLTTIPADLQLESVYTDTKLKAEKWILERATEGKQVFIYRMGNLAGRYVDGHFQQNIHENAFYRMLKLMLLVGKAPDVQWMVDFTPVDFAAEVVVASILKEQHKQRVYHVCHPNPIPFARFIAILQELGYDMERVPTAVYEDYILNGTTDEEVQNLAVAQLDGDGAHDTEAVFASQVTMQSLGITSLPQLEKAYVQKLMHYAMEVGFMKVAVLQ